MTEPYEKLSKQAHKEIRKCGKELFEKPLIFENAYDAGESLWFTEYDYNALMKMDKESHKVEWKGSFPGEPFTQEGLYSSMAACEGKLYFAPYLANEIAVYDMETEKIQKIPLCKPIKKNTIYHEKFHFFRIVSIEKKIYFIPEFYPGILCYDTEHDVFSCFDDWVERVENFRVSKVRYFTEYLLAENKLILPCACADAVVVFDTIKERSQLIQTAPTNYSYKFCGICHTGNFIYLVSADGTVSKRKTDNVGKEIKRWNLPQSEENTVEFYPVRYMNEFILLFPFKNNSGYQINTKTDQVVAFEDLNDEKTYTGSHFLFFSVLTENMRLYISAGNSRHFIQYNMTDGKKQIFELLLPENTKKFLEEYKMKDFVDRIDKASVVESSADSLNTLIDLIGNNSIMQRKEKFGENIEIGRKIYHELSLL